MEIPRRRFLAAAGLALLAGCAEGGRRTPGGSPSTALPTTATPTVASTPSPTATTATPTPTPTPGTPAEVSARSVVPVLCFHQLREHTPDDGEFARAITTPPAVLAAQLQALRDAGFETVSAEALVDHLEFGRPDLPERPILLTFDDGHVTHHSVGLPTLLGLGMVGTFFPMTVVLDKRNWLSRDHLRELAAAGMSVGAHTWDHQRLDRLSAEADWQTQLSGPREELAGILGRPVDLLAYPNGLWNQAVLDRVGAAGYRAAFQLGEAADAARPLLTIRRIMPPPTWSGATLVERVGTAF